MRVLPLYAQTEELPIESEPPRELNPACSGCSFHQGSRTICMGADGEPGGLLVVGEAPTAKEDATGRPFSGDAGRIVRTMVDDYWRGPVAYDYATRCTPSASQRDDARQVTKAVEACRGYLAQTHREVQPSRIIVLGPWATTSVLGRSVSGFQMRRSYAYTEDGVPVFVLMAPGLAFRNRFLRQWFEDDLKWAMTCDPPPVPPMRGKVFLVDTEDDARTAIAACRKAEWTSVDIESAGLLFTPGFRLLSLSLTVKGSDDSFVWPKESLKRAATRRILFDYLADAKAPKMGANGKFDALGLHCVGGSLDGIVGDVRLWRKILEPESSGKLGDMSNLVGMGGHKREAKAALEAAVDAVADRIKWEKKMAALATAPPLKSGKARKPPPEPPTLEELGLDAELEKLARDPEINKGAWMYALLPPDVLHRYNARDTVTTARLGVLLGDQLAAEPALQKTWDVLVGPASRCTAHIETWGIQVDVEALRTFDLYLEHKLVGAKQVLEGYAPGLNWSSPPQVREYLFGKLKLPVVKYTESDLESTAADVLAYLKGKHGCIEALLDFRRFSKLQGTYAQGMLPHVRPGGRIHPTILLDGARSGRASCQDPNLQNIPRADTVEGKMARDIFIARPGYKLLELDYSQIELRMAAVLSKDPLMRQIFAEGHDFHQRTAELVSQVAWGIPPEQVKKAHRSQAKAVNFGAMYGQGPGALAKKLSEGGTPVSFAEAETVQNTIFGKFKLLSAYFRSCLVEARKTGNAWTYWDGERARRRPLFRIADPDDGARSVAEHGSWNTPIQGSAADFLTRSISAVVEWILATQLDVKLCIVVHDSMLLEVREDLLDQVAVAVRDIMQSWPADGVPIVVDAKVGARWGSLVDYHFPQVA